MPGKTYPQIVEPELLRQEEARQLLVRTSAYKEYDQQHRGVAAELWEAHEEHLPPHRLALGIHPSQRLMVLFSLFTPEGQKIASRLDFSPFSTPLFEVVIPYRPEKVTEDGRVDYYPNLWPGNVLKLALPLEKGNLYLRTLAGEAIKFYSHLLGRGQSAFIPFPKTLKSSLERLKFQYRAYDLVEECLARGENHHQAVLQVTLELNRRHRAPRLKDPPASDKRYQQVRRWHQQVKGKLADLEAPQPA